ncbi:MAG: DUF3267 domain-containing protein [Firmicutes bacterium]|nr:DUF3267 domain-containing protein [Bacillota bacterium]
MKKEVTTTVKKANRLSIIILISLIFISSLIFIFGWDKEFIEKEYIQKSSNLVILSLVIYPILLILGIIIHELIHGLFFSIFCDNKTKSIEFGILLKKLAPYCHCKEWLYINEYKISIIMPLLILGVIPFLLGCITKSLYILLISIILITGCSGDIIIFWILGGLKSNTKVKDHDKKVGCIIRNNDI